MCMMFYPEGSDADTAGTKILVAPIQFGSVRGQLTVYKNTIRGTERENLAGSSSVWESALSGDSPPDDGPRAAMIIPVRCNAEDKVTMVQGFDKVEEFFSKLDKAFHRRTRSTKDGLLGGPRSMSANYLKVVKVGSYRVSIADTSTDVLERINPDVFSLPDEAVSILLRCDPAQYKFVVCTIPDVGEYEPLAWITNRYGNELVVPVLHEVDEPTFDHMIYAPTGVGRLSYFGSGDRLNFGRSLTSTTRENENLFPSLQRALPNLYNLIENDLNWARTIMSGQRSVNHDILVKI